MPPPTVRLAARAVLQHHRATTTTSSSSQAADQAAAADAVGDGDRWGKVLALQHHWEEVPDRLKIQYAQMGALAWWALLPVGSCCPRWLSAVRSAACLPAAVQGPVCDHAPSTRCHTDALSCRQIVQLASPAAAEGVTPRDLALLIARFACNNHTICDDELRPVGGCYSGESSPLLVP